MQTKTFWDACKDLSSGLFKTYAAVHKLCDNDVGYCFSKNETIGKKIKKHEVNVSKDVSELIKLGYLFSIEIKKGYVTLERRIYTLEQAKLYMEDKANIEGLYITTYKEIKGVLFFTNERYLDGEKRETTINKNANGENTASENAKGTVSENANGTVSENAKQNNTNINNTNKNINNKKKVDDDILEFLKENKLDTKVIQEAVLKHEYTLEFLKRQLKTAFKLKELGKYESAGACFSNALKNEIDLEIQLPKPEKKITAEIKDNPALRKSYEATEEKERLLEEKEKLDKVFNTFTEAIKKSIEAEALMIAKRKFDISVAPTMARNKVKYDLIKEHLKKQRGTL